MQFPKHPEIWYIRALLKKEQLIPSCYGYLKAIELNKALIY